MDSKSRGAGVGCSPDAALGVRHRLGKIRCRCALSLENQSFLRCFVPLWIWRLEKKKVCSLLCRKLPASCFLLLFGSFYGFLSPLVVTKKCVTAAERLPNPPDVWWYVCVLVVALS